MRAVNLSLAVAFVLTTSLIAACGDPTGSALTQSLEPSFGKASTTGPTVKATVPSSAPQNVTLDVQIAGTGFVTGSEAQWLLNGQPDPRVKTNSTHFVTSTSLVANITISQDAVPTLYDVAVTTPQGKKGIGTEKFTVLAMEQLALETSAAHDVNAAGVIVGTIPGGCDGFNVPVLWLNSIAKNLPMPSGLCRGKAWRINASGEILGFLYPAGATSLAQAIPVLWKPAGETFTVQELGTADSERPYDVRGFNENAHAVVNATIWRAYWWSESTGYVRLQSPTNSDGCYADGVNDQDEIIGSCGIADITPGKFVATGAFWSSPYSVPVVLPRLAGHNYAHRSANLNNNGVAIGQAWNSRQSGTTRTGVRYVRTNGTWTVEALPDLGNGETYPNDINDDGWITGWSNLSSGKTHAFLWHAGQAIKDLGAIGPNSWAHALSPAGAVEMLVVGWSTAGNVDRAIVWRPQP